MVGYNQEVSFMLINMNQMEEICCADCKKPLYAVPNDKGGYRFEGCHCKNKTEFVLPRCIMLGAQGGQMFFYREKLQA